jgi:formylglycine-generating enzyme required for sulfatase activity
LSEHSIEYRGEGPVTQPEYWLQPQWHGGNRPIVGVSWYEAQAYCAWLSAKSRREYRLPAEEEWERAARHTDGREWAWGDEWADGIINSGEAGINRTTAVGAFPRGEAQCGAQDMSGNVWEWTASFYDEGEKNYCVRGGSWSINRDFARVALRYWRYPDYSNYNLGFRLVPPVF